MPIGAWLEDGRRMLLLSTSFTNHPTAAVSAAAAWVFQRLSGHLRACMAAAPQRFSGQLCQSI